MRRKPEDALTQAVYEAYAAHEMLCMMGYDPDDVFIGAANVVGEATPCAVVWLRKDGHEMTMPVAPLGEEQADEFRDAMLRFHDAKPHMSRALLDKIVRSSRTWARAAEIIATMARKGFDIERYKLREAN